MGTRLYVLEVEVISTKEGLIRAHFEEIARLLSRLPAGDRNLTISQRSEEQKDDPLG